MVLCSRLLDMTLIAPSRSEGWMDIVLKELRILGGMGIVAVLAVHDRGVDVQMSFCEARPLGIVAFSA